MGRAARRAAPAKRRKLDHGATTPSAVRVEYDGHDPASAYASGRAPHPVDRVPASSVTAETFFANHIARRRPVVLTGDLRGTPWARARETWTDRRLADAAGDATVRVEVRAAAGDRYGVGSYETTTFREFMRRFVDGDDTRYLTASPAATDAHGRGVVASAPASRLLRDAEDEDGGGDGGDGDGDGGGVSKHPVRPSKLTGRLVPANVNVWMGRARDGASSGLHHDHHDNLYVLMRGKKKFELYAPSCVEDMYVAGTPTRVHANGRVNYAEAGQTAEDGDDGSLVARVAAIATRDAEEELQLAEEAVERGDDGASERLRIAEERMETAMDEAIGGGGGGGGGGGDDDDDAFDFDFAAGGKFRDDFDDLDEDDDDADADSDDDDDDAGPGKKGKEKEEEDGDPPSFSRVDRADLSAFPRFKRAYETKRAETTVRAGEILYLPAGWFHEVTSFDDEAEAGGGHLALNYWFHPPAKSEAAGDGGEREYRFETPYGSEARQRAWESDWRAWRSLKSLGR